MICLAYWYKNEIMSVEKYNFDLKHVNISGKYTMISDYRYQQFIDNLPEPEPEKDYKADYGKAQSRDERINVIAEKLGLI